MNAATIRKITATALVATSVFALAQAATHSASAAEPARMQTANNLKQISLGAYDGDVDGRDFLIWQRNTSPSSSDGIGNADLGTWQSNYGAGGH